MSDRLYASAFYVLVIVGSSWFAVSVGEHLTREVLTRLALLPSPNATKPPSRVDTYLAIQDRAAGPNEAKAPLIPSAPTLAVGDLAKAMDDAEQETDEHATAEAVDVKPTAPAAVPDTPKPRVAGWIKRLPKRAYSAAMPEESSGRIVMRSLRAEM
jgi:hypothetical protein